MSKLRKKLFRDIRRSKWQFLTVAAVLVLGIGFFIGLYGGYQNLRSSIEQPYEDLNFADLWISVEAPWEALDEIRTMPGVEEAEGRIVVETSLLLSETGDTSVEGRIISLPTTGRPKINDVLVAEGSYLQGDDQTLVEKTFAERHMLRVGDAVYLHTSTEHVRLVVAGIVISPEYLWPARNLKDHMPDVLNRWGVFFTSTATAERILGAPGGFNEIVVSFLDSVDQDSLVEEVVAGVEQYGVTRVVTRDLQTSDKILSLFVDSFEVLGVVFPVFFLVVAALSTYTMLSRMVHVQSQQIGVMRAIGYSRRQVMFHYLGFALMVGLLGAVAGSIVGLFMTNVVTDLFAAQINLPYVAKEPKIAIIAVGGVLSLVFTGLSGILPALSASKGRPAESMRGPQPVGGKAPLVEKLIPPLKKLSSTWKLPVRNVFRSRRRSLFTALGLALSIMLILVPMGFIDSMVWGAELQFQSIQRYDLKATFFEPQDLDDVVPIEGWTGVGRVEPFVEMPYRTSIGNEDVNLIVYGYLPSAVLYNLFDEDGERVSLEGEGVLLSTTVQRKLAIEEGDRVRFDLRPISSQYWTYMNETDAQLHANFLANATELYSQLVELARDLAVLHAGLIELRSEAEQAAFIAYGIPVLYLSTWVEFVQSTPIPPLDVYTVNSQAASSSWSAITTLLGGLSEDEILLALTYHTFFSEGWNATFPEPYPDLQSLLVDPDPQIRAQQAIDHVFPLYLEGLPTDAQNLFNSTYIFLDLDSWSNSTLINSLVLEFATASFDMTDDDKGLIEKVSSYGLEELATELDYFDLAWTVISPQIPVEFLPLGLDVSKLGPNSSLAELEEVVNKAVDEFMGEIISTGPPPPLSVEMEVEGFAVEFAGFAAFLPLERTQELFALGDTATGVMVQLSNGNQSEIEDRLRNSFSLASFDDSQRSREEWEEMLGLYNQFIGIILAFGLVIAFSIVFNAATINVLERGREIATMRTIGVNRRRIASLVTIESLIVVAFGALVGLPLGTLLAQQLMGLMSGDFMIFPSIIFPQTYILTVVAVLVVMLLSEIPSLRYIYRLNLAKVTKEVVG
ncbi:MAG: ABC transporter permease [Candidatus Geothermarchaeales archaeon]